MLEDLSVINRRSCCCDESERQGGCFLAFMQDMLHGQLKHLPQLEALSESAWPAQYSLPRPGSMRSERAQQAHAMSMGEARVHSKWWVPLRQLNHMYGTWATHAVVDSRGVRADDGAGFLRLQREWEQEEAAWRGGWANIQEQEQSVITSGNPGQWNECCCRNCRCRCAFQV